MMNEDVKKMLLQEGREVLSLADQNEAELQDKEVVEVSDEVELEPFEVIVNCKKKEQQSQISDFFEISK